MTFDLRVLQWILPINPLTLQLRKVVIKQDQFEEHYCKYNIFESMKHETSIYLGVFFNWRIIALQYCVGFCHIST